MNATLTIIAIASLSLKNYNYINMQVYTTTHSDNIYGMPFHLNINTVGKITGQLPSTDSTDDLAPFFLLFELGS